MRTKDIQCYSIQNKTEKFKKSVKMQYELIAGYLRIVYDCIKTCMAQRHGSLSYQGTVMDMSLLNIYCGLIIINWIPIFADFVVTGKPRNSMFNE